MRGRAAVAGLFLPVCFAAFAAAPSKESASAKFQYGSLLITFAEPMQTWQGLRDGAVRLQPALEARNCHWQSADQLYCSFAAESPIPASRYRIFVPAGWKTQSGAALPAQALQAETPRPTLTADIAPWSRGRPHIVLSSVAAVTQQAVAGVLRASIDGRPIASPRLQKLPKRGKWDTADRFSLQLQAPVQPDAVLALDVLPGLKSTQGPLPGTQKERLLTVALDEPFRLRGGACAGERKPVLGAATAQGLTLDCMPNEAIRLFFSREATKASLKAWAQT